MRLLLVDDVADRIERLESNLLDLEPGWRAMLAEDAEEAAAIIASRPIDAVVVASSRSARAVTDLLGRVRTLAPGAMRIAVAANEADAEAIVRTDAAHRVATAPLRAESLVRILASKRRLEAMLDDDVLRKKIAGVSRLPATPGIALDLMRENASGNTSVQSVARRLRGESAITAKILQLSNTAYYSRGTPILDIERALARLGMDTILNLVLAAESFGTDHSDLQARALLASQIATFVLRRLKREADFAPAATAATLADIGLLLPFRSGAPKRACDDEFGSDQPPLESVTGAYLLTLWGLPWPIVQAVAYRYVPSEAGEEGFGITAAVHTACALANGEPLDEALLESLDVMGSVPEWEAEARRLGAPPRPAG